MTGDTRLGADGDFKIGFNAASIGLPLPGVVLMLAADRLHEATFEEVMHGARLYRPQDAIDAGFLQHVVAASRLRDAAIAEARALRDQPRYQDAKQARLAPLAERMRARPPAPSFGAHPPQRASADASLHTTCDTPTPPRWPTKACRSSSSKRQLGHSNLGITPIYLKGSTAPKSSTPSTADARR